MEPRRFPSRLAPDDGVVLVLGEDDSCALFLSRPLSAVAVDPQRLAAVLAARGLRLVGISAAVPAYVRSGPEHRNGDRRASGDDLVDRLVEALDAAVVCR